MIRVYVVTKKGDHNQNEDRILINDTVISDGAFYTEVDATLKVCIADGVGGNKAGAVAAEFVCECLKSASPNSKNDLIHINDLLILKAKENEFCNNMATTASGFFVEDGKFTSFHIGNTRIYVFHSSYMEQITEDHTTVNSLEKVGVLSKKESELYEMRNQITACFGGGNPALINSLVFEENNEALSNAKRIVLTSDGVHEYVSIDKMEDILNDESISPLQACERIINLAKANSSNDDKSIVIIDR